MIETLSGKKNNDSLNACSIHPLTNASLTEKEIVYLLEHGIISLDDMAQPMEALMATMGRGTIMSNLYRIL